MTDDLEEIVARYAERELTLEEAVELADVDEQAFTDILRKRDVEIRPYPITRDTDEIIAYLAREMIVPAKAADGHVDEYGLSPVGRDIIYARAGPITWDPTEETPPPAIQVIEKLGITSDEACERGSETHRGASGVGGQYPRRAAGVPARRPPGLNGPRVAVPAARDGRASHNMADCFDLECLTRLYPSLVLRRDMSRGGPSVSERVVQAVANNSDTEALDLPPLFDSIDPDALDDVIRSMSDGRVSFTYAGHRINVNSRGEIRIEERSRSCESDE